MLKAGDIVDGHICEIVPVGVIAKHDGCRFLITPDELDWEPIDNLNKFISVGDEIRFVILKDADPHATKLTPGSRRRADVRPNPWHPKPPELLQLVGPIAEVLRQESFEAACAFVESKDPTKAFHALFELATRGLSREHWMSGDILLARQHPCPISVVEAVRDIAMSSWNVSLEQLPWYVAAHFGTGATLDAVEQVRRETLTLQQWTSLDSVAYWVQIRQCED